MWSRADKINLTIALVAAVAALVAAVPVVKGFWLDWRRPQSSFSNPSAPQHNTTAATIDAEGTAANLPADNDLWLVVRSDGLWYPIGICTVNDGGWSFEDVPLGNPKEKGQYTLYLYLTGPAETGDFADFQTRQANDESATGLKSLPPGLRVLDHAVVTRA
ncbi:hypothetical protein ACQP2E_10815 [Actinoplanes sp. CA-015351]|uniref:hypothetical protein n=1 Tax=Actinoplanes sp. CA-015351 TaxID=3239897 RepID=UPI003D95E41C